MQSIGSTPIPEQFSTVFGLGAPTGVFPTRNSFRWGRAIVAILLLGAAVLTGIYGVYNTYVQVDAHGPAVLQRTIAPPAVIAIIMLVIGVWLAVLAFINWNRAAVVYEKGLAYNDRNGLQSWRWEEVDYFFIAITKHYYNGVPTGTTYLYTLQKADGTRIKLDNALAKIQDLGKAIGQNVAPLQYQRLVQALRNGQTVALGSVSLNKDAIAIGNKSFSWQEVEQVGVQRGFVSVKKKNGGWFSGATARVASIPNLDAMLSVVDQIVKVKAG